MKRFRRRLFNGLATISALLFIAAACFWLRSYWVEDALLNFRYLPPDMSVSTPTFLPRATQQFTDISVLDGELLVLRTRRPVDYTGIYKGWERLTRHTTPTLNRGPSFFNRWGFGLNMEHPASYPGASEFRLLFPLWGIILLAGIVPVYWLISSRRKIADGICCKCGYDLRATPDRCPRMRNNSAQKENDLNLSPYLSLTPALKQTSISTKFKMDLPMSKYCNFPLANRPFVRYKYGPQ
jgi:hypothetical protein